jgi:hypothetical protein
MYNIEGTKKSIERIYEGETKTSKKSSGKKTIVEPDMSVILNRSLESIIAENRMREQGWDK